jgi:rod shape-determining protein MreC
MLKRSHNIALGLVILLTLILLNLPGPTAARLKLAIGSLFLPLFGLAASSQQLTAQGVDTLLPRRELLRQNERLRQENRELQTLLLQAAETARENERLRQMLGWQKQTPWKLKLATVVLRDPANWWRTIQIDLGSRDGLRVNLPVLTREGLVGRVASVSFDRAQVVLLGDPHCRVSALVENETRDHGVITAESAGPLDGSLVELGFLSRNAILQPGQTVSTSGLGGIFPKGIPVGKIVDVRSVEYGLYNQARVKLAANLSALEYVWVLFP